MTQIQITSQANKPCKNACPNCPCKIGKDTDKQANALPVKDMVKAKLTLPSYNC